MRMQSTSGVMVVVKKLFPEVISHPTLSAEVCERSLSHVWELCEPLSSGCEQVCNERSSVKLAQLFPSQASAVCCRELRE